MSLLPRRSKEAPAISICIPVFQTEQLLERCLASVAAQKETFTDFEVLIINDCSDGTDEEGRGTKQVVRRLSKKLGLPSDCSTTTRTAVFSKYAEQAPSTRGDVT